MDRYPPGRQIRDLEPAGYPLVSIVVPTYKRPDALRETLESLAKLEYPADRFEVIVVDDGSEDETSQVCAGT